MGILLWGMSGFPLLLYVDQFFSNNLHHIPQYCFLRSTVLDMIPLAVAIYYIYNYNHDFLEVFSF